MNTRSRWVRGPLLAALLFGLTAGPDADAKGAKGGHARAPKAAHPARPHPANKAPRMPRVAAPARAKTPQAHANKNKNKNNAGAASSAAKRANPTGGGKMAANSAHNAKTHTNARSSAGAARPNAYTYGAGSSARSYRARGYGSGYRNRSAGRRSGYGRSQGNNRAVVARLRSVHANLARVKHDYSGHRVRAMRQVSMAIRQLSHRSMGYRNNGLAMGMRRGNGNGNGNGGRAMTQAQSDARMSQSLRTLQGVHMQLASQGSYTGGHARARGHVQLAMGHLNTALAIR